MICLPEQISFINMYSQPQFFL